MQTIIIPAMHTRECIVVEGKKYCESSDMSKSEVAVICGLALAWFALMALGYWHDERHNRSWPFFAAIFSPIIIGPIAGLVWALS